MTEWENQPKNIEDYQGFVYEIINKINGKKYIGKKTFWNKKTLPALKGNKNKRHFKKESDWRDYWGSCNELLSDIKKYGEANFSKTILECYKTTWDCAYEEAKMQFERNVLKSDDYYNGIINCRLKGKC